MPSDDQAHPHDHRLCVEDAFAATYRLGQSERDEAIERLCVGDEALEAELRSLLAHADAPGVEGLFPAPEVAEFGDLRPRDAMRPAGARVGSYLIERPLGRGGMGVVYLASHEDLAVRRVALKLIRSRASGAALRRFHAEREFLAQLSHPNVVQLHDGGTTDSGEPFLVMEYVDGTDIATYCDSRGLGPGERAKLILEAARGVSYAHQQEILHRDLKPSNILIGRDGVPKVTDFGLARSMKKGGADLSTSPGLTLGTPGYMAPEQLEGGPLRNAPHVDCYGLGATLYRLLAGRPPFVGSTPLEVCLRVLGEAPAPIRASNPLVPRALAVIVDKAMARDPADRFGSVDELIEQLELFLAGRPLTIPMPSSFARLGRWAYRHRRGLTAWGAVAAAMLVGAAASMAVQNESLRSTRAAQAELLHVLSESGEALAQSLPLGTDEAQSYYDRAVPLLEGWLERSGGRADPQGVHHVALIHFNRARSHLARTEPEDARADLDRAVELLERLPGLSTGHAQARRFRSDLFRARKALAEAYWMEWDLGHAEAEAVRCLRLAADLVADDPAEAHGREALANQHAFLASILMGAGRADEAGRHLDAALEIAAPLVAQDPTDRTYCLTLGRIRNAKGQWHRGRREIAQAEAEFRGAIALCEALLDAREDSWDVVASRIGFARALGTLLVEERRFDEAIRTLGEILDSTDKFLSTYKSHMPIMYEYFDSRLLVGDALFHTGRTIEAEAEFQDILGDLEGLLKADPGLDVVRDRLVTIYRSCVISSLRNPGRAVDLAR